MRLYDRLKLNNLINGDMPVIAGTSIVANTTWGRTLGDGLREISRLTVSPPFDNFFVEFDIPEQPGSVAGVYVEVAAESEIKQFMDEEFRWILRLNAFSYFGNIRLLHKYETKSIFGVKKDGTTSEDYLRLLYTAGQPNIKEEWIKSREALQLTISTASLHVINAMHRRVEAYYVEHSRQQRRQFQRKNNTNLSPTDYWILSVSPKAAVHGRMQSSRNEYNRRREHKVRGHFKYYNPDKPLFGKKSGMVWCPDHVRGESELGIIRKDYQVV